MSTTIVEKVLRAPAENTYQRELERLAADDSGPRPARLAAVAALRPHFHPWRRAPWDPPQVLRRRPLIDRCIVTLMSNRGLLLVGEPGTAKSMLSELLSAAISGRSSCTLQGTAGTTEDQIKYSWNYALAAGRRANPARAGAGTDVRGDAFAARLCRFEEVTRVQPEIQDCLIGLLSDKVLHVPELDGDDAIVFAARGFNVLATANIRDRGVHEMSSALKRRFNFETVRPISDRKLEMQLVREQTQALLGRRRSRWSSHRTWSSCW